MSSANNIQETTILNLLWSLVTVIKVKWIVGSNPNACTHFENNNYDDNDK